MQDLMYCLTSQGGVFMHFLVDNDSDGDLRPKRALHLILLRNSALLDSVPFVFVLSSGGDFQFRGSAVESLGLDKLYLICSKHNAQRSLTPDEMDGQRQNKTKGKVIGDGNA